MNIQHFVDLQKDFYENKLQMLHPGFYEIVQIRNQLENHFKLSKTSVDYFMDLKITKDESLVSKEKRKSVSHLCSLPKATQGSHIIPKYGYSFMKDLNVDHNYLEFRTGDNVIKTSPNLHQSMELQGKSLQNPPLFTMVPLEWIDNCYQDQCGSGIEGFFQFMTSIGIVNDSNHIIHENMMIILQPNPKLEASVSKIKTEIEDGFINDIVKQLNQGHLFWLVHSAWTFYYWGFNTE